MYTLKAENRDTGLKPKQLRKKGIIPGVLYGKNFDSSLNIQFPHGEATRLLKSNSVGSKVQLVVDGKEYTTLLREISLKPATGEIEHLSFQALLADEPVTSTMRIVLLNREKISGLVLQPQDEISYRALPEHLIDTVEIDLDGMKVGDSLKISDLPIAGNPNIEILTPLETVVLNITEARAAAVETPEEKAEEQDTEPEKETSEEPEN